MTENNFHRTNYINLIMKNIQNQIKDIVIDNYISQITKLSKENNILYEKCEKMEKLVKKALKKLMLFEEKNQKKIYQDLNSSNDIITNCNSTRFITALDRTLESEKEYSKILINNFSPKDSRIEYKKIQFKKPESKYQSDKKCKTTKQFFPKNTKLQQSISKQFLNLYSSPKTEHKIRKKATSILTDMNDFIIKSYENNKKINKANSVKFNLNTENNSNLIKGNETIIRKERSNSVKKRNNNDTIIITNSFEFNEKKKKKYFENNSKILNTSVSKNYLNNSSIIGKKIKHIKTMSDLGNEKFLYQNPSKILKKNLTKKNGKYLNLDNLILSKSPQVKRNNLIDYKNTSVVKISLMPEKFNNEIGS